MIHDILIVGAGVVGCALARFLSAYQADILVLEAGSDVASGASKANSGIVHAGFDAVPGTLKAQLNVRGAALYPALCASLGVPYAQPGALVLGFTEEDRNTLSKLLEQGQRNGVPGLRLIGREEILALEPNTNPDVLCALLAPTSGLTSPYELTFALADHAAINGVRFQFDERVEAVRREDGFWRVKTGKSEHFCRVLVNCAGISGGEVRALMGGDPVTLIPRRGQYHLLDRTDTLPFSRTMFQCPTRMGKGVLVSPTVHGNLLLGPSAEDIPDGQDTSTTAEGLENVIETCRLTWPKAALRGEITNFAGVRAHDTQGDFIIGAVPGCADAFEAIGIESPGLSAAPAIAEMLGGAIAEHCAFKKKESLLPPLPRPKPFRDMTDEERQEAIAADPAYGSIVCRCEVVTEAEILEAIRRPVGAATIDGVKRRTRAGMGRCQGGFCSPRVASLLAGELGIPLTEVTKSGGASRLLAGRLEDVWKEED